MNILSLSGNEAWLEHLRLRLGQAADLKLLHPQKCQVLSSPFVLVPAGAACDVLTTTGPMQSLPATAIAEPVKSGWIKRDDLMGEAAGWLKSDATFGFLVAESGWSKPGDATLRHREHIQIGEAVFITANIKETSREDIATILRKSRSDRIISVVFDSFNPDELNRERVFLCDAFDCDSIIVCPLE